MTTPEIEETRHAQGEPQNDVPGLLLAGESRSPFFYLIDHDEAVVGHDGAQGLGYGQDDEAEADVDEPETGAEGADDSARGTGGFAPVGSGCELLSSLLCVDLGLTTCAGLCSGFHDESVDIETLVTCLGDGCWKGHVGIRHRWHCICYWSVGGVVGR